MAMPFLILTAALYLIYIAWVFNTTTFPNFIFYKLLPFLLSIILGAHAIKQLGLLALI